ncbi:MAG: hypothetical protein AB7O98_09305 [Hyphomonadaceae bacterium]
MIDVHIICTYDAQKMADNLVRLLEAEQHIVRLSFGRQTLSELEEAQRARSAVLLIWSKSAPSASYMREWARGIDPMRLAEISVSATPPQIDRDAHVIDFTHWRESDRGSRAWNALNERLLEIARALDPAAEVPARKAALGSTGVMTAATAGLMIMAGAASAPADLQPVAPASFDVADEQMSDYAMGGPLDAVEPISAEDMDNLRPLPVSRFTPLEPLPPPDLHTVGPLRTNEIRDATLLERLVALNPLRDNDTETN